MKKSIQLILLTIVLLLINGAFSSVYWIVDLTEEKRFTLTQETISILKEIEEVVYVEVLLEGSFPAGFKKLQRATRELLQSFNGVNRLIEYEFKDPNLGSLEEVNNNRKVLAEEGIQPTNLIVKDREGRSEQLTYPYAKIYYKGRVSVVNLLDNQIPGMPQEVVLNNSASLLEYKFIDAISKLEFSIKRAILFTSGHGEPGISSTAGLEKALRKDFDTGRINLDSIPVIPQEVALLMVIKPTDKFSEKDKFKIDQYVMGGGKVLWMIDPLGVGLDSMRSQQDFYPIPYALDLDDLWFRYGIRMQPNLVLDLQSTSIPLAVGFLGNAPQFEYFKYPYHLVSVPRTNHPVVKSLGPINFKYAATIDTSVRTKTPIQKTVLLTSSDKSMVQFPPLAMNFDFLRYEPDPARFDKGTQPLAVLYEGIFPSLYENRVSPSMLAGMESLGLNFSTQSVPNKMMMVSDGDLAINSFDPRDNTIGELGYNEFERYLFSNKDFLLNAINYLIDDTGIIAAKSKEIKLRLLNQSKAAEEALFWQLLNILGTIGLMLSLFGVHQWIRKRKYAQYG
jgi:gliding-associated putative ABC transporter substrate-binding component GldG